ncbi:MAG: acyltransferase [Proteobacteria bacterium]|nr:acyltransferase [Pseudomonadota bacterium]
MEGETYRPDIDGLRCISVLTVLAFHFGSKKISGGFIGVDVFFVISGFLITARIYKDLANGSFSLLSFYDRRMRRIMPATIVTIMSSLAVGIALLSPLDLVDLGHSAMASVVGLSNFFFFEHSGYFDKAHDALPLLHIWSLAVEEQFYLLWPLLFMFVARKSKFSRQIIIIFLTVGILLSFIASTVLAHLNATQAFFMPYTRAWELGIGALLVFIPTIRSAVISELAAAAGILMICTAAITLSKTSVFPGTNALWPGLGAAMIIMPKRNNTYVARFLSLRPIVFIGMISFSLYLWHWPIYVFYVHYYLMGAKPTAVEISFIVAASITLAIFSYYFVEQPVRRMRPRRTRTLSVGALTSICVGLFSSSIVAAEGWPERFSSEARRFYQFAPPPMVPERYSPCFMTSRDGNSIARFDAGVCLTISSIKPNILLVGDSHAAQFAQAMRDEFPQLSISQVTGAGCSPLIPLKTRSRCTKIMDLAFNQILVQHRFDEIVISARWGETAIGHLRDTIASLRLKVSRITILGPNLEYRAALPLLLAKAADKADPSIVTQAALYNHALILTRKMQLELENSGVQFYSVLNAQCKNDICRSLTKTGAPALSDESHLTREAASEVLVALKKAGLFAQYTRTAASGQTSLPIP